MRNKDPRTASRIRNATLEEAGRAVTGAAVGWIAYQNTGTVAAKGRPGTAGRGGLLAGVQDT